MRSAAPGPTPPRPGTLLAARPLHLGSGRTDGLTCPTAVVLGCGEGLPAPSQVTAIVPQQLLLLVTSIVLKMSWCGQEIARSS